MSNCSRLVLFDMNNLCIERDEIMNWDYELKDELSYYKDKGNTHFLKTLGVDIVNEPKIILIDKKKFIYEILKRFFKGYEIINCENKASIDCGHPDIIVKNSKEKIFVELKIEGDCLRFNQLKWFCKNKHRNIKILHIFIGLEKQNYPIDTSNPEYGKSIL